MATLVLQVAGSVIGQGLGGPFGAAIGSAVGATAGRVIDQAWLQPKPRPIEGPRLANRDGISAEEGHPIPRVYGRVKLGGQVIWATEFEEVRTVERAGRSGGKGATGASAQKSVRYSYFANVAIALCDGPVNLVRRIWADGKPLDLAGVTMRFYSGGASQMPDPLVVAKQGRGDLPAYRGTAYVVFERFALAEYGNRLPQFAFEVVRAAPGLPDKLRAINIIPGSTEFAYAPGEVREDFGYGNSRALNRTQWVKPTDWAASLDDLQALAPGLESATLINAWFGDDLRLPQCTFRPKVEKSAKVTTGAEWSVAGLTRATALAVSASDGRPDYGGSPSDASIIAAIRDLKARGLAVTLHPFVLMDIPPGNTRPDPYSTNGSQAAFPWRGRITCTPAIGRAGTPEGTAALNAQVHAFFGTANSAHFTLAGDVVSYSGPAEWSYRRMVLHNAMLAKAAGGVECFYLGSELMGITHLSSGAGVFPAVQSLITLAAEVRAILGPTTRITYAADWTEYGARVMNGGQEVRFPLDPLWANANINAVAIDFYPPLSDWRPGRDHADAAIATVESDAAYLRARIAAGESYDWYYANAAARAAGTRLPISDGAYGKPWIYRPKDLLNWWSNPHRERVGGVELEQATGWIARSKPIILAEIGCPAVDRGANQPNVFPDPKSSENALPHFSNGGRNDLIQRQLCEAYCDRFDPALAGFVAADNPASNLYAGRMVDAARIAPWAWDARPFPAFPDQLSLWSDGANWARGHWLNGRLETVPVAELLAMIAADFGLPTPIFMGVEGVIDGYIIDRPMSARAAMEPVIEAFGLTVRAAGNAIRIGAIARTPALTLTREDIVSGKDGTEIAIRRREIEDLPRRASIAFHDSAREFRLALASAERASGTARRELAQSTALVMPKGLAQKLAETRLQSQWAMRETAEFALRGHCLAVEPGDTVALQTPNGPRDILITRITDTLHRVIEGRILEPDLIYDVPQRDAERAEPGVPAVPGAAYARLLDLPVDRGSGIALLAVRAEPWSGPYTVLRQRDGLFEAIGIIEGAARIGVTMSALPSGPLWRWDKRATLDLRLEGGALASLPALATLAGGNALALIGSDNAIEIVLFRDATLVAPKTYRLSGLVRGIGGSEGAASRTLAAGAEAVILDDAVVALFAGQEPLGEPLDLRVVPAGRDIGDASTRAIAGSLSGAGLKPLAPVHARARREAGGVRITFIRRTCIDGDNLDAYEVPLGEEREEYRLEIRAGSAIKRSLTLTAPTHLYTNADEIADFGAPQASLSLAIRQVSARVGPGASFERVVSIP
jgi:hypothetical protein